MRIVLIGAGNVATHLGQALKDANHEIAGVYSKTSTSARLLAERLDVPWHTDLNQIDVSAGLYIFSIKDDALATVLQNMPATEGIWVHTAGSMGMDVFKGKHAAYGVFYPLQTFSRQRNVQFSDIPLLLEAGDEQTFASLIELATTITPKWQAVTSEQRQFVHAAAVFACNFTNHMYSLSDEILNKADLPFHLLHPLIKETADKACEHAPETVQTGPAIRYDKNIIQKHTELLSFAPTISRIYKILSDSIHRLHKNLNPRYGSF